MKSHHMCPRCGGLGLISNYGQLSCILCGFKLGDELPDVPPDVLIDLYPPRPQFVFKLKNDGIFLPVQNRMDLIR